VGLLWFTLFHRANPGMARLLYQMLGYSVCQASCVTQPDNAIRKVDTKRMNILFLGRVGERKGTFDLIRAMSLLPDDIRSRCYLSIAGDGDLAEANSLVNRLSCSDHVAVLGWVNREQVNKLLSEASVLALPSHMEGMSMAILEAMAAGLALVTSSSGGANEFLTADRNCLFVNPGDADAISRALAELARNSELRDRLGTEARQTAERFGIDLYIEKLTCLYEELASQLPRNERILSDVPLQLEIVSSVGSSLESSLPGCFHVRFTRSNGLA